MAPPGLSSSCSGAGDSGPHRALISMLVALARGAYSFPSTCLGSNPNNGPPGLGASTPHLPPHLNMALPHRSPTCPKDAASHLSWHLHPGAVRPPKPGSAGMPLARPPAALLGACTGWHPAAAPRALCPALAAAAQVGLPTRAQPQPMAPSHPISNLRTGTSQHPQPPPSPR